MDAIHIHKQGNNPDFPLLDSHLTAYTSVLPMKRSLNILILSFIFCFLDIGTSFFVFGKESFVFAECYDISIGLLIFYFPVSTVHILLMLAEAAVQDFA